ncbi:MAG: hypothetical protein Hens3KO_22650 [Henriciella sp.]
MGRIEFAWGEELSGLKRPKTDVLNVCIWSIVLKKVRKIKNSAILNEIPKYLAK